MAIYCANCGMELPDGVAFCDACGTPVRGQNAGVASAGQASNVSVGAEVGAGSGNGIGSTSCPVCGAATLPGEAFCDNCGASLLSPTTYAPASMPSAPQGMGAPPSYSPAPMSQPSAANFGYAPARTLAASLVITQPPPPATLQIPNRGELIVGRSDPQSNSYPDVDLGPYGGLDLGISRRHFRLTRNGDHFYLEDLNALNGSIVNGQRIPPYTLHPLRSGDRITLGKMEMVFEVS